MSENKYWMIHCPENGQPHYQHSSADSAKREAKRLAKLHPGNTFFVLKTVNCYRSELQEPSELMLKKQKDVHPF